MKFLVFFLVSAVAVSCMKAIDLSLNNAWESYKIEYNKNYKDTNDELSRRLIWEKNMRYIEQHNKKADAGEHTFRLGMNKFGDMSNEEYHMKVVGKLNRNNIRAKNGKLYEPPNVAIPDSVDWRTKGYVTPVVNQGQCGSSWGFSAVVSLEGQHFKASGKLIPLSVQNLLDCSNKQGNYGCNGGLMDQAFQYIKDNKGIDSNDSYPYEAQDGTCRFKASGVAATITGYKDIQSKNETALTIALAHIGPIAIAVDASQTSFQLYKSGIYYEKNCNPTNLDHGIAVVGYGTQGQGKDFYIVKNTWGTDWGEEGYILMSRNRDNNCGIATEPSYPLV